MSTASQLYEELSGVQQSLAEVEKQHNRLVDAAQNLVETLRDGEDAFLHPVVLEALEKLEKELE